MSRSSTEAWAQGVALDLRPQAMIALGVLVAEVWPGASRPETEASASEVAAGGPRGIADFLYKEWQSTSGPRRLYPKRLRCDHADEDRWHAFERLFSPMAVAGGWDEVVLNRVRYPGFPKTVCGVVYQGSSRRTGCQFTFTCDGSFERRRARAG